MLPASERAETRLLAVSEMLAQELAFADRHLPSAQVAILRARQTALEAEIHYHQTVEGLADYKRGLVRPGRSGEPYTADDLSGWTPPAFAPLGSESRHDR